MIEIQAEYDINSALLLPALSFLTRSYESEVALYDS
jgi:hypothetical protein